MNGDEPEVVARAAAGDAGAFSLLVELHWARLVRLARSVLGEADAEDAVQDGLVVAWERLPSLREPAAFRPWVTRLVTRTCLARARRSARRPGRAPLAAAADVAHPAGGTDAGLDVARCLAALAPRQRAVIHLTAVEGMSDSEIGRLLGITPGSVRAHRRRARRRLEHLWNGGPPE